MNIIKICPHCKKEFFKESNAQKYCSENCRVQAIILRKRLLHKCSFCGKEIKDDTYGKYCSLECLEKSTSALKRIRKRKPKISLDEVARLSREAGLSYGKYVQLHGI